MERVIEFDDRFSTLLKGDATLERLATGAIWSEGPVYFHEDDSIIWSDIPNNRLLRWSHRDGMTIWFTDPPYGILSDDEGYKAESELGDCYVFCFEPGTGRLTIATDEVVEPNGLAFSPDESVLYVADTSIAFDPKGNHHIMAFDVVDARKLQNGRVFAVIDPGAADGFRVDVRGNVFTSSADSVQVYANDGTRLGKIPIPEKVGNLTFGGPHRDRLYIAASTSLYSLDLNTQGVQRP